jgi:hypothetical protein
MTTEDVEKGAKSFISEGRAYMGTSNEGAYKVSS